MNTRSIALSLAATVGIGFAASQLKADEPAQQVEVTHEVGEPSAGDGCGVDRPNLEAWMICEGWMPYEEAVAVDGVIEPTVAEKTDPQDIDATLACESVEIVCAESVESEGISVAEEMVAGESLESDEAVTEGTVQVDDDKVQVSEQAAAEEAETTEEAKFASEELTDGSIWIEVFDACFDEGEFAADSSIREETTVEETVEAIESAEVEGTVEVVESAVEEAILDDATDNVGTEESAATPSIEEIAINGDLALDAEPSSEESVDVEALAGESTEELSEQKIDEESTVEEPVDAAEATEVDRDIEALETVIEEVTAVEESVEAPEVLEVENAIAVVESTIEEEAAVEETVEATDDVASPVDVETLDEESFEQEIVEFVQDAVACEDLTTDEVVDNEEAFEVVEPLIEVVELAETESEHTAADDVHESDTGTVRTFELGGCRIIIQSESQMDDFELLGMLWEAVDQLETEMD